MFDESIIDSIDDGRPKFNFITFSITFIVYVFVHSVSNQQSAIRF